MNSTDWDKIRAHWKRLLAVDTNSLIADLFKVNVLTDIEHEKAKKFPVSAERMEYILQQIKKKPKKDGAFEHFINALRKDKASVGLADSIMKVESRSDPLVCSKPDPHLLDEVVNTYLHDNFTNMNGKCTKVSEVKEMLLGAQIFTSENTWDDEILIEFIQKMFTNVTVEQQWSHLEDIKILTNFSKDKRGSINIESTETTGIAEMMQEKEIKCMSIPELKFFLKTNGIPDDVLAILEKEEISGEIFLSMKEEELKSVFPNASFGVRKKLHLLASKANIPMVKFKKDYLRNFDTRVSHLSKYTKGNRVDVSVHLGGKRTDPIRNFHLVEETDQDKALELIGSKFIAFISACLNDRQNGTIYFGINPENGEIVGVDISKDDLKTVFQRSMKASFIENVMGVIHKAVREAEFIPIIFSGPERFVVEIDVIPNTIIMQQENIIWTKTKALLSKFKKAHKQNKSVVFRFSKEGIPYFLSLEEFNVFEKSIKNIVLERKEEEMTTPFKTQENLRQKFLNLYTAGKEKLEEELFPFLLTSPQDENVKSEESLHLISLIQDLHPEVLFDFENFSVSSGLLNTMEEKNSGVTRTFSINDFGDHVKPQDYRQFIATLHDESRSSIPWMLSNGDEETSMDALKWNKTMRTTYQKALNHFIKIVNKDRIIVFMLLLSKNYSTMIEACEEVLAHLPDKWILLAETEDVVKNWQQVILSRGKASRPDVQKRCVIGLTWEEVGEIIRNVKCKRVNNCCEVPRSTNVCAEIPDAILLKWNDLNVLSARDVSEKIQNEQREEEVRIQENFYCGDEVDWLNFAFRDQVMERSIHSDLLNDVRQALAHPAKIEQDGVPVFTILHQPGAGGTTSAKHILWDLRKEFRCCVVLRYTKQTSDQIHAFRQFKDTNPKPVLVMVDNEDEFVQLRDSLVEKNKETEGYGIYRVYCVVIQCIRLASLPHQLELNERALRHALTEEELHWFNKKYTHLQTSYTRANAKNINPDFLIAFNILRENFKEEKIDQMVKRFTESVSDELETKLLKVVSLINAYDPHFSPIPVSCLDIIFKESPVNKKRDKQGIRPLNWEASLSEAVRVLLNISRRKVTCGEGARFIKVFHKIVARKILTHLKEKTGESESQVMHLILDFEIFHSSAWDERQISDNLLSLDARKFKSILGTIFKKRMLEQDFNRRQKFSEFILHVEATESSKTAAELIERLYSYDEDAFTAQLMARFYMDKKEWTRAETYAKLSIERSEESSYVWDTLGQIYKAQIDDKFLPETKSAVEFQEIGIHELIELAEKSLEAFRKGQLLVDSSKINLSVYFGELRTIACLLSALSFSNPFKDKNIFHRFLVEPEYQFNQKFLLENELMFLKSLDLRARNLIKFLELHLCHSETQQTVKTHAVNKTELNKAEFIKLSVNIFDFFGERTNEIPPYYDEINRCKHRLRLARRNGASSLISLLNLKKESPNAIDSKLPDILNLMLPNVQSNCRDFEDLIVMLHTVTALMLDGCLPKDISYKHILQWCKDLYLKRNFRRNERISLEMYLYYVMYNFPTPERHGADIAMQADLIKAIEQWQEEFKQNLPKIERRKKETVVFFLGDGNPLQDVLFFDSSEVLKMNTEHEQWQRPRYRKGLRVFNGILQEKGQGVKIFRDLIIPTVFPVLKQEMFQKKIFFYIGFSISGPKAFGMCLEQPEFYKPEPSLPKKISFQVLSPQQEEMTLMDLIECLKSCMSKLKETKVTTKKKQTAIK